MTTKTDTEQMRADFEAWANGRCELHLVNPAGRYSSVVTQFAWEAYQAGRAALQPQKPEPNDLMLSGVIRMPFEMAMASEISRLQFYHRAQQALNELEALQSQDRETCLWTYSEPEGAYQTACGNLHIIIDGTPAENGMKHCCYCSGVIDEAIDHARLACGGNHE
jgi:hypothetical protein